MKGLFVLALLGVVLAGLTSVHARGRHANDDYEVDLNLELRDIDDGDGADKRMLRGNDLRMEINYLPAGFYKRQIGNSAKKPKKVTKKPAKKAAKRPAKKAAKRPAKMPKRKAKREEVGEKGE